MKGFCLKLYTYEFQKHHGILLFEWLLQYAKKRGIQGGIAIRAIAGFSQKGSMHEEHFFELASNVPIKVSFLMQKVEMESFLKDLRNEKMQILYSISEVEYGSTNE